MITFDNIPAYVYVISEDLRQYEVSFTIKKPKTIRSKEVVRASNPQNARELIYARYGKDIVTNVSVKEVKK